MSGRALRHGALSWLVLSMLLAGCRDTPVSQIGMKPGDPSVTLRGELPADTALQIDASYVSSQCSHNELIFPGGDFTDPQWKARNSWSGIHKTFSATAKKQSYWLELPASETGKCRWRLDKLKMTFTVTPDAGLTSDEDHRYYIYAFNHKETDYKKSSYKFTPVIYPLTVEKNHNGQITHEEYLASSDRKATEWFLAYRVESGINFASGSSVSIDVSPTMATDYRVKVATRLDTDPEAWTKTYRATVTYPDGTSYFYTRDPDAPVPDGVIAWRDRSSTLLYSPNAPESRIATLTRSAQPESMRLLAAIYQLGHAVPQDQKKARQLYEKAALGGDIPALIWMKQQAQYDQDKQQIQRWSRLLGPAGEAELQYDLAWNKLCWQRELAAEARLQQLADNGMDKATRFLTIWRNMNAQERKNWYQDCRSR